MGRKLVAEKVKINPVICPSSYGAAKHTLIKRFGCFEITDGNC
jgi:hypothetical protein